MDVVTAYDKYQHAKSKGLPDPSVYNFTQDELKAMMSKNKQ
jgi:hypothetical protein